MLRKLLVIALIASSNVTFAQSVKKMINLEDIWKTSTFKIKDVPGFNAMKDGKHYTQKDVEAKHQFIRVYDLETGNQEKTIFDNAIHVSNGNQVSVDDYVFSKDE